MQGRMSELAVEFGPKHPRMLQVNAELAEVQQRIRSEIEKIGGALGNERELARNRERALADSLTATEAESGSQSRQAIQLRALEREAAANRALFETFLSRFKETSSTEGIQTSDSRVISRAEIPGGPSAPNRQRMLLLFVLGGFMAGCALVFGLHALHPGLLSPEQATQALGSHVIGIVPLLPGADTPFQHLQKHGSSAFIEALNSLKISLQLSDPDEALRLLQVTSSVPEEGKSTLAMSLAAVLAQGGKRVLLIDADLRRAGVERRMDKTSDASAQREGLADWVLDTGGRPEDYITHLDEIDCDFLRSGDARQANATDVFSSQRVAQLMSELKVAYDMVILDTPPVMAVADARVIGQLADKTLFVVRWDKTPRKVARAALDLLRQGGVEVAGTVLQQVDLGRYGRLGHGNSGYYYHYGRYGQYYQS